MEFYVLTLTGVTCIGVFTMKPLPCSEWVHPSLILKEGNLMDDPQVDKYYINSCFHKCERPLALHLALMLLVLL